MESFRQKLSGPNSLSLDQILQKVPKANENYLDVKGFFNISLNTILLCVPNSFDFEEDWSNNLQKRNRQIRIETKLPTEFCDTVYGSTIESREWEKGRNEAYKLSALIKAQLCQESNGYLKLILQEIFNKHKHKLPKGNFYSLYSNPAIVTNFEGLTNESLTQHEEGVFLLYVDKLMYVIDNSQDCDDVGGLVMTTNNTINILTHLGDHAKAMELCQRFITRAKAVGLELDLIKEFFLKYSANLLFQQKYDLALRSFANPNCGFNSIIKENAKYNDICNIFLLYGDLAFLSQQKDLAIKYYLQAKMYLPDESDLCELENENGMVDMQIFGLEQSRVSLYLRFLDVCNYSKDNHELNLIVTQKLLQKLYELSPDTINTANYLYYIKVCLQNNNSDQALSALNIIQKNNLFFTPTTSLTNTLTIENEDSYIINKSFIQIAKMICFFQKGDMTKVSDISKNLDSCVNSLSFNQNVLKSKQQELFGKMCLLDNLVKDIKTKIGKNEDCEQVILQMQAIILKLFDGISNLSSTNESI